MPDSIIAEATARRDAAAAEAKRWDDFIRMYSELAGDAPKMEPFTRARFRQLIEPRGLLAETEEAAISILTEAGRPVPTREMLEKLAERGITIPGKDATSTLSARLSRAPRLYMRRPHGWWIKEKADDAGPEKAASSASVQTSTPVEPGGEVAHDNIDDMI